MRKLTKTQLLAFQNDFVRGLINITIDVLDGRITPEMLIQRLDKAKDFVKMRTGA